MTDTATASSLYGRHLLSLLEWSAQDILALVGLAAELKGARRDRQEYPNLLGRSLAMIFEKGSTRTRSAFELGMLDQGGYAVYLDSRGSHIYSKESNKDTARVLGRMYDAVMYRGRLQRTVQELADHAGVPVYNALTDDFHPTQMLADLLTMLEHKPGPASDIAYAYLGDARNNMGNSLLLLGAKLGMDVRIAAPQHLWPEEDHVARCREFAAQSGARLTLTENVQEAVQGADFIHTDVWVSMGEPVDTWGERIGELLPYQVNAAVMAAAQNPDVKFMHCLPAFHNAETRLGAELMRQHPHLSSGLEVTDEVFESPASIVFDQSENRLHTIKALLVATLCPEPQVRLDAPQDSFRVRVPAG
ncbi:ornithine carbamoyltransferase, catabolic [Deinococcus piscis]|uniref:Ornithine carbamoyltransferase n=1 Tax=Deinococcus piscis TaxID=394230 RepID=A0ABQ3K0W7_9DEIO|nr:ornithine carbamoyltransferase [Deinococcus piscis]GHF94685.1 ornithine carbamoyltransferase, catabolic [Deinococcus piscis]